MSVNISLQIHEPDSLELDVNELNSLELDVNEQISMYGNSDYETLRNLPQINAVELRGNKTFEDLGLSTFDGTYEIIPLVGSETVMQTQQHYLDRNIVVKSIPYAEVSNEAGGITVTIGG